MYIAEGVQLDDEALADICRRHGVRQVALVGSALSGSLDPDRDVELLIEFEPDHVPGLLGVAAIEFEIETLIGRRVEVRTADELSHHFRQAVAAQARPLYAAA